WRGRFTLLPVFTLQYRVVEVCQQSEFSIRKFLHKSALFLMFKHGPKVNNTCKIQTQSLI
ncbi:hypothetical protein, partial [Yersinia enterocolitica]|uniref:hypothetical protein n=1 Tax=Yersinia enterocolitica TaxID=630 RepID=UPI001E5C4D83